jgi:hypothetical protein
MLDVELVLFTQRFVFTDLSAEIFEKNLVWNRALFLNRLFWRYNLLKGQLLFSVFRNLKAFLFLVCLKFECFEPIHQQFSIFVSSHQLFEYLEGLILWDLNLQILALFRV